MAAARRAATDARRPWTLGTVATIIGKRSGVIIPAVVSASVKLGRWV
jgi:hypothetical protein